MSVKVLHVVIFIIMSGLSSSLPLEIETRHRQVADSCTECSAGMYRKSCHSCSPCPENEFIDKTNKEYNCLPCFRDCRPELHLQVVSPCSKVADVVCRCIKGYVCDRTDKYTGQCTRCRLQPPVRTTYQPPAQTSSHTIAQATTYTPKQTTMHPPTWTLFSTALPSKDRRQGTFLEVCILVLVLCIVISIIMFCVYKRRKIDCLKKRLKKCSVRNQKVNHKTPSSIINKPIKQPHGQETTTQTPSTTKTDCPTLQPGNRDQPQPASGNLGPLHIYGAGTVFVSLLNQFGLNGGDKDEEDLRQQPLNSTRTQGPPSPTIPLSKEEGISYVSFPFQEQGKECHMSKEEGL